MKTIWKYSVGEQTKFTLNLPRGAQVLSVQEQREEAQLWALVDPDEQRELRTFCIFGTGWDIDDAGLAYLGTFQVHGGTFVFHLFEKKTQA